ncbi:MAG: response regulator [Anaerolineae bacterium]|nr:response regulator [Anaerolineae bacterium]
MPNNTILIVDDQLSAREVLRGLLTGQGYNLLFASNGEEALTAARDNIPDLILLDVMMPGMDGFEVCEVVRADANIAEIPILLVTALDDRDSRLRGIKAGADDFISKPYDQNELRARVQTIVKLNRYRRLHTERAKFEWVVDKATLGHLVVDEAGRIMYTNAQARRYLEIPLDAELPLSESFLELAQKYYNCEPQQIWEQWPNLLSTDVPVYLVRPASNISESSWLHVEQMEMKADAQEKYLINLRDVTEDINTRRLMWTFHAQIGHKLRTPIMLISGTLNLLHSEQDALSEEQQILISSAYKNAMRLQSEIQDVLQYLDTSHIAKLTDDLCKISEISMLVDALIESLELKSVNITMGADKDQSDLLFLPLSQRALEVVLQEILENSQKFHPERDPVIDFEISGNASHVSIIIKDDGLTLLPEQLTKIWSPYYQVERYFTGQVDGMGLGLSSVASLVWDVGGTCRAYNRTDKPGLVIELILPLRKKLS